MFKFETEIAKGHWTQEALRVPDKAFKGMSAADFKKLAPNFDLEQFAKDAGIPQITTAVAYGDTAITAGAKLVDSQPIAAWKKYLAFHVTSDNAAYLPISGGALLYTAIPDALQQVEPVLVDWLLLETPLSNLTVYDAGSRRGVRVNCISLRVERHTRLLLQGASPG